MIDGSKPADYNRQCHEQSKMWQTQRRNVDSQTKLGVEGNSAAVVCAAGGHACDARATCRHAKEDYNESSETDSAESQPARGNSDSDEQHVHRLRRKSMQMKRKSRKTRRKTKQRAAKQADKDMWHDIDNSNNHHSYVYGFQLDVGSVKAHVAESREPLRKRWPQCSGTQGAVQLRCSRPAEAQSATTLAAEPTATAAATAAATRTTAASAAATGTTAASAAVATQAEAAATNAKQLQEGSIDQYFPFEGIEQLSSAMQMWTSARIDLMDFLAELIDDTDDDTDDAYEVMVQQYTSSPLYSHAEQRLRLLLSAQGASPDEAQLKVEEVFDELYGRVCEAMAEAATMD